MKVKKAVKMIAHRAGVNISRYPGTLPRRRLALLLAHHQIDVVLDVGANVGQYASSLREFGYRGRIVSFEPMQKAYDALVERAASDSSWTAHRLGLGDYSGESAINVSANSISSSMLPMNSTHSAVAPQSHYIGTESINVERLDNVFDDLVRPNERAFLKIDTQGFEREVLAGAIESINRLTGVQLEASFVTLYDGQMLLPEALNMLASYDMTLEGVEEGFVHTDGRMFQMDGIFFRV